MTGGQPQRQALIAFALRLSWLSVAWAALSGAASITVGTLNHSLAIVGVGLGSTLVVRRRFDPETTLDSLEEHRATAMVVVPVPLPELATLGIRQAINGQWTVLGGFEWTHWSRLDVVPVTFGGIPVTDVPFKYRDGYFASIGVEYAWNEALTLRTGLGYEWSPIDLSNREVLLPDANRIWASIGLTYHLSNKLTLDAGYSHGFVQSAKIRVVPGHPQFANVGLPFFADVRNPRFEIFSMSLTYRWDDPTQTIPVTQPIIRKY